MKVFVTGGTGKIGTPLIPSLLARNLDVTVLTRSPENAKKLPAAAKVVIGDILDLVLLRRELDKADALFLNCKGELEIYQGLNAIDLARRAKIKHIVYISGGLPESVYGAAHCGVKYLTEKVLRDSGIPFTILRPNTFMQNDELHARSDLQKGIYALPLGPVGVNRVDTRDIAELAAIVLSTPGHENKTYEVAGPEVLTGEATAAIWSRAMGRPVKYLDLSMDQFEADIGKFMPPHVAHDLRLMYEVWQREGFLASREDIEQLTSLLGHPPRNYLSFCEEMAKVWGLVQAAKSA
jgi:uncharacterized protein YbjT (DUF2867 family)